MKAKRRTGPEDFTMPTFIVVIAVLVSQSVAALPPTQQSAPKPRDEIRQLFVQLREAAAKHDRAAIERLFADDYVFLHPNGDMETRTRRVDDFMSNGAPDPATVALDEAHLTIHGDVAIMRAASPSQFNATIFARENGQWRFIHSQGTRLPTEPAAIAMDPAALDAFVGRYEFGPGVAGSVSKESGALWWQTGTNKTRLSPVGANVFVGEHGATQLTFGKDNKGEIGGVLLRLGACTDVMGRRIQ